MTNDQLQALNGLTVQLQAVQSVMVQENGLSNELMARLENLRQRVVLLQAANRSSALVCVGATATVFRSQLPSRNLYFGLSVPGGTPTGTYSGVNTFVAEWGP